MKLLQMWIMAFPKRRSQDNTYRLKRQVLFLCPNDLAEVSGITLMPLLLCAEREWHHLDATTLEQKSTMQRKQKAENGFLQSTGESHVAYCNKQGTCTASSNSESACLLIHSLGALPLTPQNRKEDSN